jgi:hypothetical protein
VDEADQIEMAAEVVAALEIRNTARIKNFVDNQFFNLHLKG